MRAVAARRLAAALAAVSLAVIGAHALLLLTASWSPDEFRLAVQQRQHGVEFVLERVTGWSPRPLSEGILWLYGVVRRAAGTRLVGGLLAAIWLAAAAALWGASRRGRPGEPWLGAVLFALFLLVARPADMFFFPAGAAAYVVAIGGVAASCLLLCGSRDDRRSHVLACAALLAAAGAVEMGAAFALALAALELARRIALPPGPAPLPWWVTGVPGLLALAIALRFATHRAMEPEAIAIGLGEGAPPALVASALGALPPLALEVFGLPTEHIVLRSLALGLLLKPLLFLGFRPEAGAEPPPDRLRPLQLAAALLAAALVSMVFAYRQFGYLCCDRHLVFRQALVVLALYGLASAWPPRAGHVLGAASLRRSALLLPLLVLAALRVPGIVHDLRRMEESRVGVAATWASGLAPGSTAMTYYNPTPRRVTYFWQLPAGQTFTWEPERALEDAFRANSMALLDYFGKRELHVEWAQSLLAKPAPER